MRRSPHRPARSAFTVIEIAMVLVVIAILAAIALPNIDFARYRMDGNARDVQNQLIGAQARAVQRNMPILVTFFFTRKQFRRVDDANGDGLYNIGETINWFTLAEKANFVIPPSTIDGATPWYATGPGLRLITSGGTTFPTLTFLPNGSTGGDVVVYLGTQASRLSDFRAIEVTGATSKVHFWRMQADGTWKLSDM
jgi:prepilin-type N-terminal cleavage/methylation domain-containing protein